MVDLGTVQLWSVVELVTVNMELFSCRKQVSYELDNFITYHKKKTEINFDDGT